VNPGRQRSIVLGVTLTIVLFAVSYAFPERSLSVRTAAGLVSVFMLVAIYLRQQRQARMIQRQLDAISKHLQGAKPANQRVH
jgi:hypothetical protein